jgi:hypothetical protein
MKDITNIDALKRLVLFDVENPCKYYKFFYEPNMVLLNTIDRNNYNSVVYTIANYTITVSWNLWTKMFRMKIMQDDLLLRIIEYGISSDTAMIYNPEFNGSLFKLILLFDLKSATRPLFIYRIYDALEAY